MPHRCPLCSRAFRKADHLSQHQRDVHTPRPARRSTDLDRRATQERAWIRSTLDPGGVCAAFQQAGFIVSTEPLTFAFTRAADPTNFDPLLFVKPEESP